MNLIIKEPNGSYREIEVNKNTTFTPKEGEQYFLDNSENPGYSLDLINSGSSIQLVLDSEPKITLKFVGMADLIKANGGSEQTVLSVIYDKEGMTDLKDTVLNPDFKSDDIIRDLQARLDENLTSGDKPNGVIIDDFGSLTNALDASAAGQEVVSDSSTTPASTNDLASLDIQASERPEGVSTLRSNVSINDNTNNEATITPLSETGTTGPIDLTAPVVSINNIPLTNDSTPELSGTVDDATATVVVSINGKDYEAVNNGDGTWTLEDNVVAELSDGTTNVTVKATDIAGNVGNVDGTVVVDTTADAGTVVINTVSGDDVINAVESEAETINVTGTAKGGDISTGDAVTVTVNGTAYTTTVKADGTYSVDVKTSDLQADNTIDAKVASSDAAGNTVTSNADTHTVSFDTTADAPTVEITEDINNDGTISNKELSGDVDIKVTLPDDAKAGDTLNVTINGTISTVTITADMIANGYTTSTPRVADGSDIEVSATVTDAAGNTSEAGTNSATMGDTTAPDIGKLAITDIVDVNGDYSVVTLKGIGAESGNTITIYDEDNNIVGTTKVQSDGTWSMDISNLPGTSVNDNEFFKATETDLAGNTTGQTDSTHYWHGDWSNSNTESSDDFVMTGAGDDIINTDDLLTGRNENGNVTSDNNDTNDKLVIDGGDGNDTVTFGKDISEYTITKDANGNTIITETAASDSNNDGKGDVTELRNIEFIEFKDGTYNIGTENFIPIAHDDGLKEGINVDSLVVDLTTQQETGDINTTGGIGLVNDDHVIGGSGNQHIWTGSGDDIIEGGSGNDIIYSGAGNDVVVYQGKYSDYSLSTSDGWTYINDNVTGRDGNDKAYETENIQFSDGLYNVATGEFQEGVYAKGITYNNEATLVTDEDSAITVDVLANDTDADGDKLAVSAIQGQDVSSGQTVDIKIDNVVVGSAKVVDGKVVFIPDESLQSMKDGDHKNISFEYTVSDGKDSDTAIVNINVTGENDAPVVQNIDLGSTLEDTSITFTKADLLAKATDVDGDTLSVTSVSVDSKYGKIVENSDGSYTFTPKADYSGDDLPIKFTVSDGVTSKNAVATIDVTAVADAPSINMEIIKEHTIDVNNVSETSKGYTVTAFGVDGKPSAISTETNPNNSGFGVSGKSSGNDTEIGHSTKGTEVLRIDFDHDVSNAQVSLAWLNPQETAEILFYKDGINVGKQDIHGGSDGIDDFIKLQANNSATFDTIAFYGPKVGDDFIIHALKYNEVQTDINTGNVVGDIYDLDISSSLRDTDGSESLSITLSGIPTGVTLNQGTLNSDGTWTINVNGNSFDGTVEMTVPKTITNTFNVTATATAEESSNHSSKSGTVLVNLAPDAVDDTTHMVDVTTTTTIFNTSFDSTYKGFLDTVEGWNSDGKIEVRSQTQDNGYASDGTQYIELNKDPANIYSDAPNIYRTIHTEAGAEYKLDFDFSARPGYDASVCKMEVLVNGEVVGIYSADGKTISGPSWQDGSITFTGDGSDIKIEFRDAGVNVNEGRGMFLDKISLEQLVTTSQTQMLSTDEDKPITVDVLANDIDLNGDNLSITQIQGQDVSNGQIVNVTMNNEVVGTVQVVDGKVLYTPDDSLKEMNYGQSKNISFDYTISDGHGGTDSANVNISVTGVRVTTIFNSSFEMNTGSGEGTFVDTIDGWKAINSTEKIEVRDGNIYNNNNYHYGPAFDGNNYIELNTDDSNIYPDASGITRTVNTINGAEYKLDFNYSARPGFGNEVCKFDIVVDGKIVGTYSQDGTGLSTTNWISDSISFIGTGKPIEIQFRESGNSNPESGRGMFIDDISLVETVREHSVNLVTDDNSANVNVVNEISQNINLGDADTSNSSYNGDSDNNHIIAGNNWEKVDLKGGNDTLDIGNAKTYNDSEIKAGDGDDTIKAGNNWSKIDLGNGNDTLDIGNAKTYNDSEIKAGDGDDTIKAGNNWDKIDGGSGNDTLVMNNDTIDLSNVLSNTKITNIENIDLTNNHAQQMNINLDDILDITDENHELKIFGDSDDKVTLEGGNASWTNEGTQTIDGETFHVYQGTVGSSNVKVLIDDDVSVTPDV